MTPRPCRRRARGLVPSLVLLAMLWLLAAPAAAQARADPSTMEPSSVAGTWAGVIDAPTGRVALTFQLQQEGERVVGSYDYRGPVLVALNVRVTGFLRGSSLTLFEGGTAPPVFDGRVEGKSLTGVFRGSGPPGRLEAVRID